jgi:hypothetical protein
MACAIARVTNPAPASSTVQAAICVASSTLRRWKRIGRVEPRSIVPSGILTRVA